MAMHSTVVIEIISKVTNEKTHYNFNILNPSQPIKKSPLLPQALALSRGTKMVRVMRKLLDLKEGRTQVKEEG